jgi:hypothetical protein
MASLIEFHKWAKDKMNFNSRNQKEDFYKVDLYKNYLESELGMKCEDNGTWSHWGNNAHRWNGQFGDDIPSKNKKTKVVTLNQWLKDTHPEILREYKQAI